MLDTISSTFWAWIMEKLPAWLVKRVYRPERLKGDFDIDFRSIKGVAVDLGPVNAELQLWLRYTNRSLIDVVVETVKVEAHMGSARLRFTHSDGTSVPRQESFNDVLVTRELTESRRQAIAEWLALDKAPEAHIRLDARLSTKVGRVPVSFRFDNFPRSQIDHSPLPKAVSNDCP